MTRLRTYPWLQLLSAAFLGLQLIGAVAAEVLLVDLTGAIGPATAAYVEAGVGQAQQQGMQALVLRIDTPGGLDTAMRTIVKAITASRVPVIGYVAPTGARAASAGTYILYACHIAAMAPGTNLGAATPVEIGGLTGTPAPGKTGKTEGGDAMTHKLVNDAAAYLRGLAELRGRNAEWAEQAVREGASLSAEAARDLQVVDLVAPDLDTLLHEVDGRTVQTAAGTHTLQTAGATIVERHLDWQTRLLAILSEPNIAYILLLIGFYGVIYEFANPGTVLPGTVGVLCLLLALYAFQLLPVNWTGLALIAFGLGLMIAEAFVASGALGLSGAAAFVIGSLILIDREAPGFGISIPLIGGFALTSALLLFFVVGLAVKARRLRITSGAEALLDATGIAISGFPGPGTVHLLGEQWGARSTEPIGKGQPVRVRGREGLVLLVEPLSPAAPPAQSRE
jgi:membrane-bound serine protease (ClpP class)